MTNTINRAELTGIAAALNNKPMSETNMINLRQEPVSGIVCKNPPDPHPKTGRKKPYAGSECHSPNN